MTHQLARRRGDLVRNQEVWGTKLRLEAVPTASRSGVTIQNSLMGPEGGSERLLVMLPGRNYSCDAPALYYLGRMAVAAGFDVLSTAYGFQQTGADPDGDEMLADVKAALEAVLPKGYRQVCIAAKSIGSAIALPLARSLQGYDVSLIVLTPVGRFLEDPVGAIRTLVVIGTADPVYQWPECTAARERGDAEWVVLPDLNHGFNVSLDWERSIAALPEVIHACRRFLTAG